MTEHLHTKPTLSAALERLATTVVDCCFRVHAEMGPGLLESVYEHCLHFELASHGLRAQRQIALPVTYRGTEIEAGYRIDLLVEGLLVIELKAVPEFLPIHQAQMMTYLRLSGCEIGFLVNFNVTSFKGAIRRFVLSRRLPSR